MVAMFYARYNILMQSSKTSKPSRKKAIDAAASSAEKTGAAEVKITARAPRAAQSKKTVDPVPAAAKSHRKPAVKSIVNESTVEAIVATETVAPKAMAAAAGQSVALSADPVGPVAMPVTLSQEEVAKLAYSYWVDRNYEHGYAEQDWHRAIIELSKAR